MLIVILFIPLILIFVIFYFFLIRPQQRKAKETGTVGNIAKAVAHDAPNSHHRDSAFLNLCGTGATPGE